MDEAKVFLPGGVVILNFDDIFVWKRGAPKWAKYSKVRRWKIVTIDSAMSVTLDGKVVEPEEYVERNGF